MTNPEKNKKDASIEKKIPPTSELVNKTKAEGKVSFLFINNDLLFEAKPIVNPYLPPRLAGDVNISTGTIFASTFSSRQNDWRKKEAPRFIGTPLQFDGPAAYRPAINRWSACIRAATFSPIFRPTINPWSSSWLK